MHPLSWSSRSANASVTSGGHDPTISDAGSVDRDRQSSLLLSRALERQHPLQAAPPNGAEPLTLRHGGEAQGNREVIEGNSR